MLAISGDKKYTTSEIASIFCLSVICVFILIWRWVGYQGHDDYYYAIAALDWVHKFPAVGENHWALRYPLVMAMAACLSLTGSSIFGLAIPNLVIFLVYLLIQYLMVRRYFGALAAFGASIMAIVLPQFSVQATYANPDLLEMVFVMGSLWSVIVARHLKTRGSAFWMMGSGILAGLAFITRETAIAVFFVYAVLFIFKPLVFRWKYLLIGAGFLFVFGLQTTYLAYETGDFLYRERISATHDSVDRSKKEADATKSGATLDSEGVLAVKPVIAPLAVIFVSQKYGFLFLLGLPALVFLRKNYAPNNMENDFINCLVLCGVFSYLFIVLNINILYIVPRYFMVSAACFIPILSIFLVELIRSSGARRVWGVLLSLSFVGSSLGLLYLENVDPMRVEQDILRFAASARETVSVDPETFARLSVFQILSKRENFVVGAPPAPGGLVAHTEGVIEACSANLACGFRDRITPFVVGADWTFVKNFAPPRRSIGWVLQHLRLEQMLPTDLLKKIEQPGLSLDIYRTPSMHVPRPG